MSIPDPASTRWAVELYDLIRVFRRISSSIYGLLTAEISWVLFLILLGKISPSGSLWLIALPGISIRVVVASLWLPGATLMFLLWLTWSRFATYVFLSLGRVLSGLLVALGYVGIGVYYTIVAICLPATIPLQRRRALR